jgi:hypothetical protein
MQYLTSAGKTKKYSKLMDGMECAIVEKRKIDTKFSLAVGGPLNLNL